MKNLIHILLFTIGILAFLSCKNTHGYEKHSRELDSLKIVVEQAIDNFKTVDSLTCYKAFAKQQEYSEFITTTLKDTVTIKEAEALQIFFSVGEKLKEYINRRQTWLLDAKQTIVQLTNLSHDLKKGALDYDEAIDFINTEKKQSEKIIEELKLNTIAIRNTMDAYTQTLPTTELIVHRLKNTPTH